MQTFQLQVIWFMYEAQDNYQNSHDADYYFANQEENYQDLGLEQSDPGSEMTERQDSNDYGDNLDNLSEPNSEPNDAHSLETNQDQNGEVATLDSPSNAGTPIESSETLVNMEEENDLEISEPNDAHSLETNQDQNGEVATLDGSSNAGTPIENSNIPVNVDDGNDIEKLDFSSQYTNPNGTGDDLLTGTEGANTFDITALLNAKPEIYQQHVDGEGKIDWEGVTGENNNYHDHWLDGIGQDTIMDFSGSGGDGDKVNIVGHTVALTVLEESDNQIKLGLYADQGADGSRGDGAHDFDVLGTLTINHDGNFNYGSDVTVNPNAVDGAFEFA